MSAESLGPELAAVDYEAASRHAIANVGELLEVFESARHGPARVRLVGTATRQDHLPAPTPDGPPVELVSLARLDRITRLEADDLTCSVEPGVPVATLQDALAERGVRLPVEGTGGTVGGLFAAGDDLPPAPGAPSTRHLLLGLAGVLAEGKRFKAGARVVKSVAGFDLQKLFVGSRGRLFAAVELHLKLRPLPKCVVRFRREGLSRDEALVSFRTLRREAFPPAMIRIESTSGGAIALDGRYEGAPTVVDDRMQRHGLEPATEEATPPAVLDAGLEELVGVVRPSRIGALLDRLPSDVARWSIGGTGRLVIAADPNIIDDLLARLPDAAEISAELQRSTRPSRRGFATPRDPGVERVTRELAKALDPHSILT